VLASVACLPVPLVDGSPDVATPQIPPAETPRRTAAVKDATPLRSRSLWLGLLGLAFLGASWVGSMWGTRGVSWRWRDQAVFLAVSDGSVRLGYEGKSVRESGFDQWSIPKGQYLYSEDGKGPGWFAPGSIRPYEPFEGWIVTMPHWLLVMILIGLWAGFRWLERRGREKAGGLPERTG
jgi:hypothetical protein